MRHWGPDVLRRLAPSAMMLCLRSTQYAIERRFRPEVLALIGQSWHNLTRWQTGMGEGVVSGQDLCPFVRCQLIARGRSTRQRPTISPYSPVCRPPLDGPHGEPHIMADPVPKDPASASSSSARWRSGVLILPPRRPPPRIAWAFFEA